MIVAIDPRVFDAFPWTRGIAYAEPGTVLEGPAGDRVRVRADGGVDPVPSCTGLRSIAADPTARTERKRAP